MPPDRLPATLSLRKLIYSKRAVLARKVTPHTLCHCFAIHLLDHGTDVRFIQELLGHKELKTTLIYTHLTNKALATDPKSLDQPILFHYFSKKPQEWNKNYAHITNWASCGVTLTSIKHI